jgi:ABC-2 type transport system permease protein
MGFDPKGGVIGVVAAVGLALVFAFGLSWVWTTLGLLLRTPNAVMSFGLVVLFPLAFMSNIFVRPETMPFWLQSVTDLNPVTHLVTAVRGLMEGTPAGSEVVWVLAAAAALTLVFAPLTAYLYQERS